MQERKWPPKAKAKRGRRVYLARKRRCCWSDYFAGGAVVEAGGGVVAHGRRLPAAALLFQAGVREILPLPFSYVFFHILLFFSGFPFILPVCCQVPYPVSSFSFLSVCIYQWFSFVRFVFSPRFVLYFTLFPLRLSSQFLLLLLPLSLVRSLSYPCLFGFSPSGPLSFLSLSSGLPFRFFFFLQWRYGGNL